MARAVSIQLGSPYLWTAKRQQAARLIAESFRSIQEIAKIVKVSDRAIYEWRKHPEFAARVEELTKEFAETVRKKGVAVLERRIESYLKDFEATDIILQERGAQLTEEGVDPKEDPYVGGARTGYITRDYRGKDADRPVYQFDNPLFRARLALREQLAKELGQWTERTKNEGVSVTVDLTREALGKLSNEELAQYEALLAKAMAPELKPAIDLPALPAACEPEPTDDGPEAE